MSLGALAAEANVDLDTLALIESVPTEVSKRVAFSLAEAMSVPVQFLFYREVEVDDNIPDFRTAGNKPAVVTSSGLLRLARARSITAYLADNTFAQDGRFKNVGSIKVGDVGGAVDMLSALYIPVRRPDGSVDPTQSFRETRVALEKKGIIVLCDRVNDAFRGFCYARKGEFPIIFVNTTGQRPATKLFTLMHEVVHVLIGSTGISDPSILNNKVEQFCNRVAASVMMPSGDFAKLYNSVAHRDARTVANLLSRAFGASKQAAALRVTDLGLNRDFYATWTSALPTKMPPIEEEDEDEPASGGGGISSQIARFGYLLPNMLVGAVQKKAISQYDAYRLTHLKPKTISQIAEIGVSRLGQ